MAAIHALGYRIIDNTNSMEYDQEIAERLEKLFMPTLIKGYTAGAGALGAYYFNVQNDQKLSLEERIHVQHRSRLFKNFAKYRRKQLNLGNLTADQRQRLDEFVQQLEAQRARLGMGEFEHIHMPDWPGELSRTCWNMEVERSKMR